MFLFTSKKKIHINAFVEVLDLQNPKWPRNRCWALIGLWATITCQKKTIFGSGASRSSRTSTRGGGGGGTWVKFCWVGAAGLSEPLPHYSLFSGQL